MAILRRTAAGALEAKPPLPPGCGHRALQVGCGVVNDRERGNSAHWERDLLEGGQCINAKAETLEQRSTFREAFQQRRCVVPADGFYEWTGPKNKRQPLWIHPRSDGLMLFAGLYEFWYPEPNQPEVTFTIVTCAANAVLGEIH